MKVSRKTKKKNFLMPAKNDSPRCHREIPKVHPRSRAIGAPLYSMAIDKVFGRE